MKILTLTCERLQFGLKSTKMLQKKIYNLLLKFYNWAFEFTEIGSDSTWKLPQVSHGKKLYSLQLIVRFPRNTLPLKFIYTRTPIGNVHLSIYYRFSTIRSLGTPRVPIHCKIIFWEKNPWAFAWITKNVDKPRFENKERHTCSQIFRMKMHFL